MYITDIEQIDKKRFRIYIEEEYLLLLYITDLRKYKLEVNQVISKEEYLEIYNEVVLRRAKLKAMLLLKSRDYTQKELRMKLVRYYYPDQAVDDALSYVMSYGYIDDERYAKNYVRYKMNVKSRRQIEYALMQKGLDKYLIEQAFDEEYGTESHAIENAIRKKIGSLERIEELSKEDRQKIGAYLFRKGFSWDEIQSYMNYK